MNKVGKRFIIWLLGLDALLIVLHVFTGWDVFNLDQEMNLPTWYSSAKLLLLALMAVLIWDTERKARNGLRCTWLWLVVGLLFLGLSVDETACVHERMARYVMQESGIGLDIRETVMGGDGQKDSFAWVFLLSPFILGVAVFFLVFFVNRMRRCRTAAVAALVGLGLFLLAIAMEATMCVLPPLRDWSASTVRLYNAFIAIEESGEIFGATLFILAFLAYLQCGMTKTWEARRS